jgi:hypothetical protein
MGIFKFYGWVAVFVLFIVTATASAQVGTTQGERPSG